MTPAEQLLAELTGLPDGEITARLAQEYPAWTVWRHPPDPWWAMRTPSTATTRGITRTRQATVRAYTLARLIQQIAERDQETA